MQPGRERLIELGVCEEAIAELQQARTRLPREIEESEARAQAARDAVEAARERLEELEKARRAREGELQDAEAKRTKLQGQTALVKTNTEYTALLREIDQMDERISELEEGILVGMEAVDDARSRLESEQKEQDLVERRHLGEAETLRGQLVQVEQELARRLAERDERLGMLGTEARAAHDKIARAHGSGVASIRDQRCSGCHRSVPPQTVNLVLSGELHTCTYCQRILVPCP